MTLEVRRTHYSSAPSQHLLLSESEVVVVLVVVVPVLIVVVVPVVVSAKIRIRWCLPMSWITGVCF